MCHRRRSSRDRLSRRAQARNELDEILWQRRLEFQQPVGCRVAERQSARVERLTRQRNRPQRLRPVHVPLLADERVPPQPGLNADLGALARDETHLDERRAAERLDDPVFADGLRAARIARVRLPSRIDRRVMRWSRREGVVDVKRIRRRQQRRRYRAAASRKSPLLTMSYRSNTARVLWPVSCSAPHSGRRGRRAGRALWPRQNPRGEALVTAARR